MSLRTKFMLALLLTGLAAVAMVGGLAYVGMTKKVDSLRRERAADSFHQAITAYLTQYGSWQDSPGPRGFERFMRAREQADERPPLSDGAQDEERRPPPEDRRGPPEDGQRPPPDEDRHGADDGRRPPPPGQGQGQSGRRGEPPYHFILVDPHYRVLLGAGVYEHDELLPEAARKDARPVRVNGQVLAYVSPEGVITPSKQELQYLAAMREALWYGVSGAAILALVLGLLISRGLGRTLGHLTSAVRAMHGGSLLQRVPVEGKDEVAELAAAFNAMSEKLARSHEELSESHQTILAQAEQLRELSVRDALTKLHNRRHFDEQASTLFSHAVRHKRPLSMVIGDIDFFKKINDQFSHATGDAVLRQVGEILRSHMRLSDLVARYGGEEFVIAFPETELAQAAALCDKLRAMIESFPWHQVHPDLKVTMSMGVCADLAAGTAEAMLQKADALLYRAKETGRNRVCFAA
ncbi:diguanylate cyclase (GGDEF)-like protein [Duganella sp. 1224]|uniref:diguanylate cyclase n=1 Tax=Duganella sp. 1224 TaxID=2587052 RepID=UPI0015CD3B6C|nr:diguanylate cyclase [Duganella sp. 1224]NYE63292.1 diguanylate cyclase (GGDEF)-like protein [Duganella sp. 1224]